MDWNNINTDKDTSGLGPIEYDQSKVPELIRKYADNVRTKTYGQEVREAQARNAELAGLIASEAVDISNETKGRQDTVETQFNSVQQELTDKDPISAPEIIAARNGEATLSERLVKDHQEVTSQLAQIVTLNPLDYEINGDGTDETTKVKSLLSDIPSNGAKIIFDKNKKITINGVTELVISGKNNVVIEGLNIIGSSVNVFKISGGSSNITFRDCTFKGVGQVFLLFDCSDITVDNCLFEETLYGIIQQAGYASDNVKVINNVAKNIKADFVECNSNTMRSKNWTITGNHFMGSLDYPTVKTESRFVGITQCINVIIANNIVEKVAGDSAIHLEVVGGDIHIQGNIFDNVLGTGYIYIMHNEKTATITGNTFKRTDTTIGNGTVYAGGNAYSNDIIFSNNKVIGTDKNLDGINMSSHSNALITGNIVEDCSFGVRLYVSQNLQIVGNKFKKCDIGIGWIAGPSGNCGTDIQIIGNVFMSTVTKCLYITKNTGGTGINSRWLIQGNVFDTDTYGYDTTDFTVLGNVIANGKTLNLGAIMYGGGSGYVHSNNREIGKAATLNYNGAEYKGTGVPTVGTYAKNDKILNTNPTAGSYLGWLCITAGAPGIWKGFGLIET